MSFGITLLASHRGAAPVLASFLLVSLSSACGSSGGSDAGTTGNATLKDQNNYKTTSKLTIPHVATAAGVDLNVCWTTLATDLLGHAVDPVNDIDTVTFLQIPNLTEDQIAAEFAAGTFVAGEVKLSRDYRVDHTVTPATTCASLSAFKLGASYVVPAQDYVVAAGVKYLLLFAKGTTPGIGSRSMVFLDPTATSTETTVNAPQGLGILQFAADLTTPLPVNIPAAGPWVVDWSQLTQDGAGSTVIFQKIDSLLLGYYDGMSVAALQAQCLDYDRLPNATLYHVAIPTGDRSANLANTRTTAGVAFTGFTPMNGVWAVGLLCSTCQVPAPLAIAILNPG
jgi:hypothetical protein